MRVDGVNNNNNGSPETLKEHLFKSASLERALCRMCITKEFTHPTNGSVVKLYSFDLMKTMEHFSGKYEKIKCHLAEKYVKENRGFILHTKTGAKKRTVIKQEAKQCSSATAAASSAVKTENGVKAEGAAGVKNEQNPKMLSE